MLAAETWTDKAVSWTALVSSLVAIRGFTVLRRQVKRDERNMKGAISQFGYSGMSRLLEILIEKPHLRPYIYDNRELPTSDDLLVRDQVLALGEQYADFFDAVLHQNAHGNASVQEYIRVWKVSITRMLESSSVIRDFVLEHQEWYSPQLHSLARGAVIPA